MPITGRVVSNQQSLSRVGSVAINLLHTSSKFSKEESLM